MDHLANQAVSSPGIVYNEIDDSPRFNALAVAENENIL
jgi:hypothetical protein